MSSDDAGLTVAVLTSMAVQSPLFLAWIVGIALAAINWRKNPRVSLLVTIALGLLLLVGLVGGAAQVALPIALMSQGLGPVQVGAVITAVSAVRILIDTAAWALLLVALFRQGDAGRAVAGQVPRFE
jgi:hypothetical protein